MRLSSTIILITWCLTFIVIASIFVAKKVVMKNRIVIRYRNSYAINLVTNSEKPKIIVKGKSPEVPFHGITLPYSYFEVI